MAFFNGASCLECKSEVNHEIEQINKSIKFLRAENSNKKIDNFEEIILEMQFNMISLSKNNKLDYETIAYQSIILGIKEYLLYFINNNPLINKIINGLRLNPNLENIQELKKIIPNEEVLTELISKDDEYFNESYKWFNEDSISVDVPFIDFSTCFLAVCPEGDPDIIKEIINNLKGAKISKILDFYSRLSAAL